MDTPVETPILEPEPQNALRLLAEEANEKLETTGQSSASGAMNLGCSVGLGPLMVIVVLIFLSTRGNWIVAAVATLIGIMVLMGFSNLAAYTARGKSIERTYQRDIAPEIERTLKRLEMPRHEFEQIAAAALPDGAVLLRFLAPAGSSEEAPESATEK